MWYRRNWWDLNTTWILLKTKKEVLREDNGHRKDSVHSYTSEGRLKCMHECLTLKSITVSAFKSMARGEIEKNVKEHIRGTLGDWQVWRVRGEYSEKQKWAEKKKM